MSSLRTVILHRLVPCMCLGLAFLSTTLASFGGHLPWDPAAYTAEDPMDELLAAWLSDQHPYTLAAPATLSDHLPNPTESVPKYIHDGPNSSQSRDHHPLTSVWDSDPNQYTPDDLFAVLPLDHQAGPTPFDKSMWEADGYQLYDNQPSEPRRLEFRQDAPYPGNPATSLQAGPSSSNHPYSFDGQVWDMDEPSTHSMLQPPSRSETQILSHPPEREKSAPSQNTGIIESLSKLRLVCQQYFSEPPYRRYFTSNGNLAIRLLKTYRAEFRKQLNSIIATRKNPRSSELHPSLACARLNTIEETPRVVVIIMRRKHHSKPPRHRQDDEVMMSHYRNLIVFMHRLYEERLDKLPISTVTQIEHQEKMLQWFHQEFFDPTDSPLPAMGFPKGNNGVDNFPVGPVQAKLVEYFSQPKDDLKLLHITAPWLLNEFHKKHNTDGLSEQDVIQPQAIMQSQVDLYAQSLPGLISSTALVAGLQNPYRQDVFTTHMLETLADSLGHQIDSLSATCGKVKYIHPELRIGIVESDALRVVHFSHQIRILKAGAPVTLASDELLRRIKRVLSFVDRFHFCQFTDLYQSQVIAHGINGSRRTHHRSCLDRFKGN
ncbi:hypothetical protein PCANC_02391 [Puccinia coronata f. sp. avenae]|uniref:Uncharacterized protein n=1 Tax=Puccinia coronata f. sp. avenae TaxID=200324 RepID=A0A2N5W4V0_9BASI|nr:hypothetical protein PCANC_02391 [Puccinia coronata f. sp. avenae]